jgi:hypothetical protein
VRFSFPLFLVLFGTCVVAQTASRTFEESFPAKERVTLKQNRGPVSVLPSTDGRIRVLTRVDIEARRQEDAEALLAKVMITFDESRDAVTISGGLADIRNWNQNNNRINLTFRNGDKIRDVRKIDIATTIYLPVVPELIVESRFLDVEIDEAVQLTDVVLRTNNVDLRGGNLSGDLKLDARFGRIELGSVGGAVTGKLNNMKLRLRDSGSMDLETRFTEVVASETGDLRVDANNSNYEISTVTGSIEIEDRFGDYAFGTTQDARIRSNNGGFRIETGLDYFCEGRFTKLRMEGLTALYIGDSHNSEFVVDCLGSVEGEGKFTHIKVDRLTGSADLELANGGFRVDELSAEFTGITVSGNFSEVELAPVAGVAYRIVAELDFGTLDVPREVEATRNERERNAIDYAGHSPGAGAGAPTIRVAGNNTDLRIR